MNGYIFICSDDTENECLERCLFGTDNNYFYDNIFTNIKVGDYIFLWNYNSIVLHGIFKAVSKCKERIEQNAWGGGFPYQLKIV